LLSYLNRVYHYSCIEYFQPLVVVTYIDNSALFQWLSNHYNNANFFAIQNGSRTKKELQSSFKNNLTNFFCFGDHEKIQYLKYGHNANQFIPIGSLQMSIVEKEQGAAKLEYDIAIISQYNLSLGPEFEGSEIVKILLEMHQNINHYLLSNLNLSYIILCRQKRNSSEGLSEELYYKSIYGDKVELRFQDECKLSTYKGISQSKLIISCCSTCLSEAAGWGKKVLFCDYSSDNSFAEFKSGIWLTIQQDYDAFANKMDKIISMDQKEYDALTNSYFRHIMNYSDNVSTIDKIRETIFPATNFGD
jgi:surface carbohydrate biosynthesis protein